MAASDNQYPIFEEEYPTSEGRFCNHRFAVVNPRDVQTEPCYDDQVVVDVAGEDFLPSPHNGAVTQQVVCTAVGLTYNAGDRTLMQNESSQDVETQNILRRSLAEFNSRNETEKHMVKPIEWTREQHYHAEKYYGSTNPMFDDAQNMEEPWGLSISDVPQSTNFYFANPATFGSALDLRVVRPIEHLSAILICPHCSSSSCKTEESLKRHIARHDAITYFCNYDEHCPYSSKKQTDVRRHVDSVHRNVRVFQCLRCDKSFARKDNWKRHVGRCERTRGHTTPACYQTEGSTP
jgi:hypothetical protein